jgi:hypothetical protein
MSDTFAENKIAALPTLNKDNYPVWIWSLESALRSGRVWKEIFALDPLTKLPPKCPTDHDDPAYDVYMEKAIKACGWIDEAVGYEHLAITEKIKQKNDAVGMLGAITTRYAKKTLVNRHQALVKLLNVTKKFDESCSEFTTRVTLLLRHVRVLRPVGYTLADLDDEICTQGLLSNLDHSSQYYSTVLSLTPLDFDTVASSMNERDENHAGSVPFANKAPISSTNAVSDAANLASGDGYCRLCERTNHFVIHCPRLDEARDWLRSQNSAHAQTNGPMNNSYQRNNGWNNRGWRGGNHYNRGGGRGNNRGGGHGGNSRGGNSRGS